MAFRAKRLTSLSAEIRWQKLSSFCHSTLFDRTVVNTINTHNLWIHSTCARSSHFCMRFNSQSKCVCWLVQAGKEIAHVRSSQPWCHQGQGTSSSGTALPLWQEQALTHLQLLGPDANLEVAVGGEPCIDPRLLAAVRILYCWDPSELRQGSLAQLGAWGVPLNPANEVRLQQQRG